MPRTRTVILAPLLIILVTATLLVPGWIFITTFIELFTSEASKLPVLESKVVRDTVVWTLLVMFGAVIPGFPAGVLLGRLLRTRFGGVAAAVSVLSLCLPGYAIFWFWWQGFGPDGMAGSWFLAHGLSVELREGLLLLALITWSWPLVAWPVALETLRSRSWADHAALDGVGVLARSWLCLRSTLLQVVTGMILVGFMVSTATISFDLAQVRTYGFELRAFDALGYPSSSLIRFSMPVIILSLLGSAACVLFFIRRSSGRRAVSGRASSEPTGIGSFILLCVPAVLVLAVPVISAGFASGDLDFAVFGRLHGAAALRSLSNAALSAVMCAALGGTVFLLLSSERSSTRMSACLLGSIWIACCLLPGTVIAAAITSAFNGPSLGPILYDSGWGLSIAHLAAAGGIAVLIGLLACLLEPRALTMSRALDPFRIESSRPRLVMVVTICFLATLVFTFGDLILGARLAPPGQEGIGGSLLNAMHYQRPDTVVVVLGILVGLAALLAVICGLLLPRRVLGMIGMISLVALVSVLPLSGCGPSAESAAKSQELEDAVPSALLVGAPGRASGLFETPRGMALDPAREVFYVVDKTARVQRFGFDGLLQHSWQMPESSVGKPVGLTVAPDGRVFVADTHYHRIIVFDADGRELDRFGTFGTGPGEFVYPTDIVFADDGTMYIAEYGTNDRVQVFSETGEWIRAIGTSGRGQGALARPQSIALSLDGSELFVADSCNHRISVFGIDGEWRRDLGRAGHERGEFNYPYGLHVLDDGSLLVCEYGGDRIQHLDPLDGVCLGIWGGTGFVKGRLHMPWAVGAAKGRLFVLDSGNSRVQIGDWPPIKPAETGADGLFID
jgi:DNA-binding beta-propeller fold protein YncE